MSKRLFFFGIDSATWDLIKPWVKMGKLPGFSLLLKEGSAFDLQSTNPPLTPVAWTSLYTGVNAGKHGLYDFYRFNTNHEISIYLASDNRLPTLFEILSRANLKVAVANLPFSYPPKPINGIMLSCFLTPGVESDFIYPRALASEFKELFPKYRFTEESRFGNDRKSQDRFFRELIASVREKAKVFDWLENKDRWDLFAVNFMEVDHAQHWFFKDKKRLLRVYQEIDRYLLRKLKEKKFDRYLLFSDHGAGDYEKNLNLNAYFLKKGLLKLKRKPDVWLKKWLFDLGFTPGNVARLALRLNKLPKSQSGRKQAQKIKLFLSLKDIDWLNSTAFSFGYYGSVFLIKKDKQSVLEVKKALTEIEYTGQKVIDKIWLKKEVYCGPYLRHAPDILYSAKNYSLGASAISPFLDNKLFTSPHTLKSGEHRPLGTLAFFPKIKTTHCGSVSIYDLSATILELFGLKAPGYFDGHSILNSPKNETVDIEV